MGGIQELIKSIARQFRRLELGELQRCANCGAFLDLHKTSCPYCFKSLGAIASGQDGK